MASQITGISNLCSTVCLDQRKYQSSASLAFAKGIHRWPMDSPNKGQVTRKMFPFDYVIMGVVCVTQALGSRRKPPYRQGNNNNIMTWHDDVIKQEHFPRHWPFVRGLHQSPVNSPHRGQWRELWCFLWSGPVPTVEQTMETPVIWDAMALVMTSL